MFLHAFCRGKIAVWLSRCVWNSLPRAFHRSLHLLAFRAWCQASVDLACVSYEPLLFGWVLCFREGYSSQVTSFAAQCVVVRRESVSFVVVIEDRIWKEFFKGPCSPHCSKALLSETDLLVGLLLLFPLHTFQQTREIKAHGAVPVPLLEDWSVHHWRDCGGGEWGIFVIAEQMGSQCGRRKNPCRSLSTLI